MNEISEYEQFALNKLGQTIHEGKWSNDGLVQLIELIKEYLNPVPMQEYANKHGISYNGLKNKIKQSFYLIKNI